MHGKPTTTVQSPLAYVYSFTGLVLAVLASARRAWRLSVREVLAYDSQRAAWRVRGEIVRDAWMKRQFA